MMQFLAEKIKNHFLIVVNYVELIKYYVQPPRNVGFEPYQYFRVINLLLRTQISAPPCYSILLVFGECHQFLGNLTLPELTFFGQLIFGIDFFTEIWKIWKKKCVWNLKSNTVFPSRSEEFVLQSFNIKARSLVKNNRDSWICWYVKQDLEDCKRQLLQGRRALCTVSRHNLIRIMMP